MRGRGPAPERGFGEPAPGRECGESREWGSRRGFGEPALVRYFGESRKYGESALGRIWGEEKIWGDCFGELKEFGGSRK